MLDHQAIELYWKLVVGIADACKATVEPYELLNADQLKITLDELHNAIYLLRKESRQI